jgi:hypothetical protein
VPRLILPRVDAKVFTLALCHFTEEVGCGKDRRILLVLDQAGWHTGMEVEVPGGIYLEFLPDHSRELQPAERLWPLANEVVANRLFEDLDQLEEVLVERCVALLEQTELIRSHTLYHWGPMPQDNRGVSMRKRYHPPLLPLAMLFTGGR